MLNNLIRFAITLFLSIALGVVIMFLGALIINKTNVGEGVKPLFSVMSTAASSVAMSFLLSKYYKIKNIYCAAIAVLIITVIKIAITIFIGNNIVLNLNNMIDILFIVLFSFIGALLYSNAKK